jgi:hypothetical protein
MSGLDAGGADDAAGEAGADPADPSGPGASRSFDEHSLLDLAREHSVGRFGHDCTRARHASDAAAVLEEQVGAAERNRCEFIPCEGGFLALRGSFDPIAAATIQTAVLPLAPPPGRRCGLGRVAASGRAATARWRSPTPTIWCTGATAAEPTWTTSFVANTSPWRAQTLSMPAGVAEWWTQGSQEPPRVTSRECDSFSRHAEFVSNR